MKKYVLGMLCAILLAACNNGASKKEQALAYERDSLMMVISDKDSELNEIMGTVSEIQDGFRRINEAEGRITVNDANIESESTKELIRENMQYIQEVMAQNRDMIAQLKEKLRKSAANSDKLKQVVADFTTQLEERAQRIQVLEAQLAEKDILIARQGDTISNLNANVNLLTEENKSKTQVMIEQDRLLHTAWYVFGTKAELKEQKILKDGDVLKGDDFNKDYFTKVDIRYDKEIKLYSKSAKLLTVHPVGSYRLEKDNKEQYVLHVANPDKFWSVSKYLVIQVK